MYRKVVRKIILGEQFCWNCKTYNLQYRVTKFRIKTQVLTFFFSRNALLLNYEFIPAYIFSKVSSLAFHIDGKVDFVSLFEEMADTITK